MTRNRPDSPPAIRLFSVPSDSSQIPCVPFEDVVALLRWHAADIGLKAPLGDEQWGAAARTGAQALNNVADVFDAALNAIEIEGER